MNKQEFLETLENGLNGLPQDEIDERLSFYGEMIDDRIEEGLSEEDAVFEIGSVDEIVAQIIGDVPLAKLVKQKVKAKRKMKAWEIVLLSVGSPLWIALLIAAFAVVLSLYVAIWSVIISLWAVFASAIGCALGGIIGGAFFIGCRNVVTGIAIIGAGIVFAGLSVLFFFGCKAATKGILLLTRKVLFSIKNCFVRKGAG